MPDAKPARSDPIREQIAARVEALGVNANALAVACQIDPDSIRRYLAGRSALNSRYVSAILAEIGWDGRIRFQKQNREKSAEPLA